jgi:hypothetical protein
MFTFHCSKFAQPAPLAATNEEYTNWLVWSSYYPYLDYGNECFIIESERILHEGDCNQGWEVIVQRKDIKAIYKVPYFLSSYFSEVYCGREEIEEEIDNAAEWIMKRYQLEEIAEFKPPEDYFPIFIEDNKYWWAAYDLEP